MWNRRPGSAFKKARLRFVNKRVAQWLLREKGETSTAELIMMPDGASTTHKCGSYLTEQDQVMTLVRSMGFQHGFLMARHIGFAKPDGYIFCYKPRIKMDNFIRRMP